MQCSAVQCGGKFGVASGCSGTVRPESGDTRLEEEEEEEEGEEGGGGSRRKRRGVKKWVQGKSKLEEGCTKRRKK